MAAAEESTLGVSKPSGPEEHSLGSEGRPAKRKSSKKTVPKDKERKPRGSKHQTELARVDSESERHGPERPYDADSRSARSGGIPKGDGNNPGENAPESGSLPSELPAASKGKARPGPKPFQTPSFRF